MTKIPLSELDDFLEDSYTYQDDDDTNFKDPDEEEVAQS